MGGSAWAVWNSVAVSGRMHPPTHHSQLQAAAAESNAGDSADL